MPSLRITTSKQTTVWVGDEKCRLSDLVVNPCSKYLASHPTKAGTWCDGCHSGKDPSTCHFAHRRDEVLVSGERWPLHAIAETKGLARIKRGLPARWCVNGDKGAHCRMGRDCLFLHRSAAAGLAQRNASHCDPAPRCAAVSDDETPPAPPAAKAIDLMSLAAPSKPKKAKGKGKTGTAARKASPPPPFVVSPLVEVPAVVALRPPASKALSAAYHDIRPAVRSLENPSPSADTTPCVSDDNVGEQAGFFYIPGSSSSEDCSSDDEVLPRDDAEDDSPSAAIAPATVPHPAASLAFGISDVQPRKPDVMDFFGDLAAPALPTPPTLALRSAPRVASAAASTQASTPLHNAASQCGGPATGTAATQCTIVRPPDTPLCHMEVQCDGVEDAPEWTSPVDFEKADRVQSYNVFGVFAGGFVSTDFVPTAGLQALDTGSAMHSTLCVERRCVAARNQKCEKLHLDGALVEEDGQQFVPSAFIPSNVSVFLVPGASAKVLHDLRLNVGAQHCHVTANQSDALREAIERSVQRGQVCPFVMATPTPCRPFAHHEAKLARWCIAVSPAAMRVMLRPSGLPLPSVTDECVADMIDEVRRQGEQVVTDNTRLRSEALAFDAEQSKLQSELASIKSELQQWRGEFAVLRRQKSDMSAEMAALKAENSNLLLRLQEAEARHSEPGDTPGRAPPATSTLVPLQTFAMQSILDVFARSLLSDRVQQRYGHSTTDFGLALNPQLRADSQDTALIRAFDAGCVEAGLGSISAAVAAGQLERAYHGTSVEAAQSILRNGFDPGTRANQVKGPGEYFDTCPNGASAKGYMKPSSVGVYGAIIVTLLLKPKATTPQANWRLVDNPHLKSTTYCLPVAVLASKADLTRFAAPRDFGEPRCLFGTLCEPTAVAAAAVPCGAVEFEDDFGRWVSMDAAVARMITNARDAGLPSVAVTAQPHQYVVDIRGLTQRNVSSGKVRSIRFT